jgi:hypothetical protein
MALKRLTFAAFVIVAFMALFLRDAVESAQQGTAPHGVRRGGPRSEPVRETQVAPDNVREISSEILKTIVDALSEGDYSLYGSRFSSEVRKVRTMDAFLELQQRLRKKLGKFKSVEYLGFYLQAGSVVTLFKARFSKDQDDVLIKLVLEGNKTTPLATGLWFDSPRLAE